MPPSRPALVFAAVLAALAACRQRPTAPVSALQRASAGVRGSGRCSPPPPQDAHPSYPLPSLESGRLTYRMFYYSSVNDPSRESPSRTREAWAEFAPDGQVLECRVERGPAKTYPPGRRHRNIAFGEILDRERRLVSLIERLGEAYARGGEPTPETRGLAAQFIPAFSERVDVIYKDDYRAVSPAFWDWIEKNGGGKY